MLYSFVLMLEKTLPSTHQINMSNSINRMREIITVKVDNVFNKYNTNHCSGAGTVNPSGASELTSCFSWSSCCSVIRVLCNVL